MPHLLKKFVFVTTDEIADEMNNGQLLGFKDARIIMQYITDARIQKSRAKKTDTVMHEFHLHRADASVIALAQEVNGFLATEDRQIEKICLITQTKVTNTAALLYHLWKHKEFSNEQTLLLLDLLTRNGYNKEICLKLKEKVIGGT
ncbi:hypothetical protein HY490_04900 [Candidatus Woesearchaeota archaeon]|nr:hypothetical protein [Candidatus Woesearchaeota archaeon]